MRNVVGKKIIGSGKWIRLLELDYSDSNSAENNLKWEMVERTTKTSNGLDGVDVIAIIEREPVSQIVLVSQFRPPLNAHCIEFPAGLITEIDENPICAALRELSEETGYYGYKAELINNLMFSDSGVSNCNLKYVKISIDPTDVRNVSPEPSFQDEELITTHLLSFDESLYDNLVKLCSKNGFVMDARLASVALGMKLISK